MSDTGYRLQHVAREQVELQPWTPPDKPLGEHDVRGRSLCTLVSPGTELHAHYLAERFPSGSGYANVGEVLEVGSAVEGLEVGDVVFSYAGHASHFQMTAAGVTRVPAGLAPEFATVARLIQVPMTTLITTAARPGDIVLVSGCGPVGYLAAEIFRLSNYEVTIVEPHAGRRAMAEAAGHRTLPACPLEDPAYAKKVALVVECSGHEQAVLDALLVCRKLGEVAMVGVPWRQRTDLTAHAIVQAIFHNYVTLRTGWEWELPRQPAHFQPHHLAANQQTALRWLNEGRIKLAGVLSLHDPRDCQAVYQGHLHQTHEALCTVFDWRQKG